MTFTLIVAPGTDPGPARAHAARIVVADGPQGLAEAARACPDPFVLLLARDAVPFGDAFGGVRAALHDDLGVLGGAQHAGGMRRFGWMLGPAPCAPLPFELVAVEAPSAERGVDAFVRGPLDVVVPGMVLVRRELLADALPDDPVAAVLTLSGRAREAGWDVVCRPSFAFTAPPCADDRGRAAALRAVAGAYPELRGAHRTTAATRRVGIDRETPVFGGSPLRVRRRIPPTTALVDGAEAAAAARALRGRSDAIVAARAVEDAAAALRAEMRVRGDRYVLIADAGALPDAAAFDAMVEQLESAAHVALVVPNGVGAGCALIAVGRFPQHVVAHGETLTQGLASLVDAAAALRRGVRPASAAAQRDAATPAPRKASLIFLAGSRPAVTKLSFDAALVSTRPGDELVAVCAAGADTTARTFDAFADVRVELDEVDPLLTAGANRAIAAARNELIVVLADDLVVAPGWLDAIRAAFARVPLLGAALPCVPGAPGEEGLHDIAYADLSTMRTFAQRRAVACAREAQPIDDAGTPAIAVAREAFEQVGGIDPRLGPTRRGIAELVLRLRCAGYEVVRCDDAFAHRLDAAQSGNAAAASLNAPGAPDAAARAAAIAAGFDPARRVPFVPLRVARERVTRTTVVVLPVADAVELERAAAFLSAAAAQFDAGAAIRLDVVLDGPIATSDVVARIRAILAECGRPLDDTVAVRVERTADLSAWAAALGADLRVLFAASHGRPAFTAMPTVAAHALGELFRPAVAR